MRIVSIGGGPAGSFFSYFLLIMAERVGLDLGVDIYEPRDFDHLAPLGCNMCGGVISESLVQNLAAVLDSPARVTSPTYTLIHEYPTPSGVLVQRS